MYSIYQHSKVRHIIESDPVTKIPIPIVPVKGKGQKHKKVVIFLKEKMEFVARKDEYKNILIWLKSINSVLIHPFVLTLRYKDNF